MSEKLSRFRDSARKLHPYFQSRLPDGESSSLSFLLSLKISQVSSSGAVVNSSDGRRHLISSDGRRQFFRRSTSSHLFRRSTPILPTVDVISSLPTVDVISSDGRRQFLRRSTPSHLFRRSTSSHLFRRSTSSPPTVDANSCDGRRHLFRRAVQSPRAAPRVKPRPRRQTAPPPATDLSKCPYIIVTARSGNRDSPLSTPGNEEPQPIVTSRGTPPTRANRSATLHCSRTNDSVSRISLKNSQCDGCSTENDTPARNQVVCRLFLSP